ncbi:hypothetical protein FLM55_01655 [Francisella sp. Scap27]|uniref:hypothetical protein n=1 Tax=Francisella sp. Scap27 TaxID=2589986 RepID=UPI0015BA3EA9|nr:hypothetical protein [Francisella sp. Scap27]QLE78514.1 hypothetical protein FLM55_01655 [Francisella sp. Scap27]
MLKIYKDIFDQLNRNNVQYCVYKSLNFLQEDLKGNRGDIDILIDKKDLDVFTTTLKKKSVFLSFKSDKPYYFIGIDQQTHKFILIDLNTNIQFGPKPYKPFHVNIDFDKLKIVKFNQLLLLSDNDYIPLMFLMRILSLSEKQQDLNEIKEYLINTSIQDGYIKTLVESIVGDDWQNIVVNILKSASWKDLKGHYSRLVQDNVNTDNILYLKQSFRYFLTKMAAVKNRIFKKPNYRIRKRGCLIAFVGVDGAGKSSTIEYVCNLKFFNLTGIKRVYFGNNEYWIPGLLWLLEKQYKNKYLRLLLSTLVLVDRKLRIYIAKYYMLMGNHVVADRYFYDDLIGKELNKDKRVEKKGSLKKVLVWLYTKLFRVNSIIKKPDVTIFLDVSPDVAYQRKQDYSYEKMLEVNKAYKDYMYNIDEVKVVDTDMSQKEVYTSVVDIIIDLDKKNQ